MLAPARRPYNPNRSATDVTGWNSGDLSAFLSQVNTNRITGTLNNEVKISNKNMNYFQTAPKRELVAEIISTFNINQLKLLDGIFHMQNCNDRLIKVTKNTNNTIIQLNNKIIHLETRQNTLYSLIFKAMHPLPATTDIIGADLIDDIIEPTKTPLKQSQTHTIQPTQLSNKRAIQREIQNSISQKLQLQSNSSESIAKQQQTPSKSTITLSNKSIETVQSSLPPNANVKSSFNEFVPLRKEKKLLNKAQINYNTIQSKKKKIKINNNTKQKNKNKFKKHHKNKKKSKIINNKNKNHKLKIESQNDSHNHLQTKLKSKTKLIQLKSSQMITNKQPTPTNNATTSQIKPIDPIQTKDKINGALTLPTIKPSNKLIKHISHSKTLDLSINPSTFNETKLIPLNSSVILDTSINNKITNKINSKEKNYIKIQINDFKKDELDNFIIIHKFTQDQYADWVDFKLNIRELTAKEYYEMIKEKITDKLLQEWLDAYGQHVK